MRISDWSSDVCSSDLGATACPADAGSRPGALLRGRRRQAKLSFLIAPVPCMSHYEGDLRAPDGARFAIIASRWNPRISDALVAGARETFAIHGIAEDAVDVVRVPGAWETPPVAAPTAPGGGHEAGKTS